MGCVCVCVFVCMCLYACVCVCECVRIYQCPCVSVFALCRRLITRFAHSGHYRRCCGIGFHDNRVRWNAGTRWIFRGMKKFCDTKPEHVHVPLSVLVPLFFVLRWVNDRSGVEQKSIRQKGEEPRTHNLIITFHFNIYMLSELHIKAVCLSPGSVMGSRVLRPSVSW